MKYLLIIAAFVLFHTLAFSQLQITQNLTPTQLVHQVLVGSGVTISNVTYTGDLTAIGKFSNGGTTNIGFPEGVLLTTGKAINAIGPNNTGNKSFINTGSSDPQLAGLVSSTISDAAVLEFDFVPIADTVKFRYVFGSEEYNEFVNSNFNDVFGFFITGVNPAGGNYTNFNMATLPNSSTPVAINNVNNGHASGTSASSGPCTNCAYYVDNTNGLTIQYDGLTTILEAWTLVTPCSSYHFKAAIGDAFDYTYDSGVFIEAGSFSTNAVTIQTNYTTVGAIKKGIEGCNNIEIKVLLPKVYTTDYVVHIDTMWGTATNGVDFPHIADSIVVPAGQLSSSLLFAPIVDHITEGLEDWNMVIQTSPCTIDTLHISILDYVPITVTSIQTDTFVCEDSLYLWLNLQDGWANSYKFDWTPTTGINNPTQQNTWAMPAQTTNYFVSITDSSGCPAVLDSINVEVHPKINVSFIADKYSGCEDLTVAFTDMTSPAVTSWLWNFGDGDSSLAQNPIHTYTKSGVFDLSIHTNASSGCIGEVNVPKLIHVWPKPEPNFYMAPAVVTVDNPTINFNNLTAGSFNYLWKFGDGATDVTFNTTHTYANDADYTVWLIAESDKGCIDSVSYIAKVVVDEIEVPNIITPNNDGINDVFEIKNITRLEWSRLVIYNRWGTKVYSIENYKNDWDGDDYPDGVYYWHLEYKTFFREAVEKGTLTIIR